MLHGALKNLNVSGATCALSLAKIPSGTEIAAIVSCANLMRAAHSLFRFVSGLFELLQDGLLFLNGILITFLKDWRKRY